MNTWTGVGVMSGSSMDGVDMCCAEFTVDEQTCTWDYNLKNATTIPYNEEWTTKLHLADSMNGEQLIKLHTEYGLYLGELVHQFIDDNDLEVDFVGSHGHTVFHQPQNGFTFQMGDGESMVSHLSCPLVTNFRNKDLALGGQGAPLVPVGEQYLFSNYDMCLNLGGISNISIQNKGFDISPCNMLLNYLAKRHDENLTFDRGGEIAKSGEVINTVLNQLESLNFYSQPPPKSLGKEWFVNTVLPILNSSQDYKTEDLLRTSIEHISNRIVDVLNQEEQTSKTTANQKYLLVTGGGAMNTFLIERLCSKIQEVKLKISLANPEEITVRYKEALIFAFLGLRCLLGVTNISRKITGSKMDSVSGSIHIPPRGTSCRMFHQISTNNL